MTFPYDDAGITDSTDETPSVDTDSFDTSAEVEVPTGTEPEPEANSTESEQDDFNFDQYGDRMVTVKVDGEELQVPLKEVREGYMRQADYTRKTQDVAAARQQAEAFAALQQALQERPADTIRALQERFGFTEAQAEAAVDAAEDGAPTTDPAFAALQQQVQQITAAHQDQMLAAELDRLQQVHGEFDTKALVRTAMARGVTDISHLEDVYKQTQYDALLAKYQALETHTSGDSAEDTQRQAAGAAAANATGAAAGTQLNPSTPSTFSSLDEAFAAAERDLGIAWD